jgi:hypothetical protein
MVSRVATGGHLIVSVPTTNVPLNRKHYRHYTLPLLMNHLRSATFGLELVSAEFVFDRSDRWYAWYKRLSGNRHWYVNVYALERRIWSHVWTRMRRAGENTGAHLQVVLRRK